MRKILGHHRAVKRNQSSRVREVGQQRGQIAVADKNLGMCLDLLQIENIEKIVRAVSAPGAHDRPHFVADEHFFQFPRAPRRRPREVEIVLEDGIKIERLVSQVTQSRAARFQHAPV